MHADSNLTQIAEEHAHLEQTIARYDHAPAELRDTTDLLEGLERDLKVRESHMEKLIRKRKAEHKDLDKLQRSSTKRFLVRMKHGGKEGLERKLEKEEREYIEAAQDEHNENLAISELKEAAEQARLKKADLESQVVIREEMLRRLNELYKSAFEGPSPDFPEEDAAEEELREAEMHFENASLLLMTFLMTLIIKPQVQTRLSHEKNVFSILDQVATCANQAQSALRSANSTASYEAYQFQGSIWARMDEADDLIRAQAMATQAQRLLDRAQRLQPLVTSIEPGKIASPDFLLSVFDNMYTNLMFQQEIRKSIDSVRNYQEGISAECSASEERIKNLDREAKDAREFLKSRRRQLVATRREILSQIREDGGVRVFIRPDADPSGIPQLPAYAPQPEEGSTVLAMGQSITSISIPAREEQCTLSQSSHAGSPPSFAVIADTIHFPPPEGPPPSRSGNESSVNTPAPPLPRLPSGPSAEAGSDWPSIDTETDGIRTDGYSAASGSLEPPDSAPTQSVQNKAGRNETQFASNNPYKNAIDSAD
ncbi:hypothetical protein ACEPAH_3013 [Sanghuangporus vaninii]